MSEGIDAAKGNSWFDWKSLRLVLILSVVVVPLVVAGVHLYGNDLIAWGNDQPLTRTTPEVLAAQLQDRKADRTDHHGKRVRVSGQVMLAGGDEKESRAVLGSLAGAVSCEFRPGQDASRLKPGSQATINGTIKADKPGARLTDCVIVSDR